MYLGSLGEGVVPPPQLTVASVSTFYIQFGFFPPPWERRFLSPLVTGSSRPPPFTALCDSVLWPASPGLQDMTPYAQAVQEVNCGYWKSWCPGTSLEDGL